MSRSRVELSARPTSPSARARSTERVRSWRPRLELLEQAHVLDGDHRLVGEGLQQLDLLVGERADLAPATTADDADRRRPRAAWARPGRRCGSPPARRRAACVLGITRDVGHVDHRRASSRIARPVRRGPGRRARECRSPTRIEASGVSCAARRQVKQLAVEAEDDARRAPRTAARRSGRWRRRPAGRRSASSRSPAGSRPSPSAAPAPRSPARGPGQRAFFACSSVNSRTFSMAITAWSAKVFDAARSACR